jgi:hypothetical protein
MKKGIFSKIGFATMIIALSLTMPTVTLGASLRLISSTSYEDARFNPPALPFAPYDPNNPNFSIEGQIEGLIGTVLDWLGISPVGSIYGPGISSWDNYVGFMDHMMYAQASAVGTVASFADVLLIGDTQYVKDWWHFAAIYELNGDPGETANVRLDYAHDYTYYNLALAGRSRAVTDVEYGAYIIPAARTGAYSQEAANNLGYRDNPNTRPADASFWGSFTLHGGAQYKYLGGFIEDTDHKIGSFELGSMSVGDRLYVYGYLYAATECEMYHPPTLDVATMFPSFNASLIINGNIRVFPASSDFGLTNVGSSSTRSFQVSNKGITDLVINSVTLLGTDASDFRIKDNTCGWTTILPSRDCTIVMEFLPTVQGIKNPTLSILSNDLKFPSLAVPLTGEGTLSPVFDDCQEDYWAEDFINTLYYSGITSGCSADPPQFCPETPITRGQMAVFIETSLRRPPNTCTGRFTDVPIGNPFCGFIERMADDGITAGCGGNNFCPDAPVTRGQMAVFILAALGNSSLGCTGKFTDVPASNGFCGFIERLADDGITGGCGPGVFCPGNPVTRAEMAVFLVAAPPPLFP